MSGHANITPQSGRRPRLGLGRRGCQSSPLKRLQKQESSVNTPKNENVETPKTLALSLSARRIGLSKNRTELTKKKLEFAVAQEFKDEEQQNVKKTSKKEATKSNKRKKGSQEECRIMQVEDNVDLDEKQDLKQSELQDSPKSSKITELKCDIEIWRQAFIASVDDLLTMVEPGLSKNDLLAQLGIPLGMLRYLEEE
ncbi:uncharacterized protein LOC108148486 [Drosophila elegans]|uniref:uncharacterized protein LOC108148486 n=1 Tax=Drosophila elegans TaxID=30023 RepID=UPI0007E72F96|nr:uncharacterized protein LOC108148486 [Drosophila elegans]